ncbi:uncharacterized protein C10orf143 homolog [Rhinatrema bivittatum]|uniref:uncharacterized protein C10orf143 homolog n=1 Tax=Rhinatrema bivittatum TaxID=194408 RepID=UPI001128ACAB|nr:uncharacterized protein C10orf143 homolog [Rhinatrema bivittatum]XP_029465860.1 uncharacterized protein C10orf143 homolog [Rhinatrema bivittatum]
MDFIALRKRQQLEDAGHPNNKRICKGLETLPNGNSIVKHQLNEYHIHNWDMQHFPQQSVSSNNGIPEHMRGNQNYGIFQNQESRGLVQPCPRCIAGESGHFNHIMDFQKMG